MPTVLVSHLFQKKRIMVGLRVLTIVVDDDIADSAWLLHEFVEILLDFALVLGLGRVKSQM